MNPLTANPAIAIQYARRTREDEMRPDGRHDRAIRAARTARAAIQRARG